MTKVHWTHPDTPLALDTPRHTPCTGHTPDTPLALDVDLYSLPTPSVSLPFPSPPPPPLLSPPLAVQAIGRGLESLNRIVEEKHLQGVYGPLIQLISCHPRYFTPIEVTAGNK